MAESGVYVEKMARFAGLLRQAGLAVGTRETADACTVLTELGFEDRELVKTALRTVFAKSREEQLLFDSAFDCFFLSEEELRRLALEQQARQQQEQAAREKAMEDLQVGGRPMDLTEEQRNLYLTIPEEARERLRRFLETYEETAERSPKLYDNFIRSVFLRTILEEQMRLEDAGLGCEGLDPEIGLLYRDISRFRETDIPKAIAIIQDISQQINGQLSASRQLRSHSGQLDFRRTIRLGLETGGSFYRLANKRRRRRKKHLVLLCDVSGSMIQFSEFALRFIQSLNHVSESSRTFLFSEELHEADAFSLQNMDLFRSYVRQTGIYGKGTDLGMALEGILAEKPPILNSSTTLLILTDTKTIDQPRAIGRLLEAKRMAGRVILLNPIPESKWPYLHSAQAFGAVCPMVSCSTLSALAAACRRLTV